MPSTITRLNPTTLPDAAKAGYAQISITEPGRLAFVSGQVAWTPNGGTIPDTIKAQTAVVVRNLRNALAAIGAGPQDIAQMRIYVVDLTHESQTHAMEQIGTFLDGALPSITGIGVSALAAPELLIEIEMTVSVP